MKILHTGDWHIGDFPGPSTGDGLNARSQDTLERLDQLCAEARSECPDLIVVSGDVFHASRTWSNRGIREVEAAAQRIGWLSEVAPVVVIRGTPNHDGSEHFSILQDYFANNSQVLIFTEPGNHTVVARDGSLVGVCVLPGFDKGYWRAHNPGVDHEDESEVLSEALNNMVVGMAAMTQPYYPKILVAHYTVEGCNTESGQTMMFSKYEPAVSQHALATAGYDLCLFGHIHRPQAMDNHAFYCGAVNAMNFNDEGQDRGYYIHELTGNVLTNSTFHSLNPRLFKTIRLNDEQVADFNLSGKPCWAAHDVAGAIVRVLYNCTDEHHKALNRAQMESALYSDGAFWVQEITPENITITANRNALTSDNTPESNLRDYLQASGVDEHEIEEMMPLARGIIASVIESTRTEKPHGLFVPVEISVTNYRNYRDETFNFDDISFCTINGVNGAGKSSLFCDAIYDALYEDPREGDLTGWICNDESVKSGAIKFTFRVGEQTWRVSRTRVKSGKATLNLSELVDGEWQDRSREKMRDTQAEIERLIGMDGMTLRACALIMQDQYGLFLQADKESRMKILSDILGLQIYDEMAEIATTQAADANRKVRQLQAQKDAEVQRLPDIAQLRAEIAGLDEDIKANAAQQESENGIVGQLRVELSDALRAESTLIDLGADRARLKSERTAKLTAIDEAKLGLENVKSLMSRAVEITGGVAQYHAAVQQRDSLLVTIDARKTLKNEVDGLNYRNAANERELERVGQQLERHKRTRDALDARLAKVPEMEAARDEGKRIEARIAEADEVWKQWNALNEKATAKRLELQQATATGNAEYKVRASEIAGLQQQANLLADSGCPTPENATCRFLAMANEAAKRLPGLKAAHESATETARQRINALKAELEALETARNALPIVCEGEYAELRERKMRLHAVAAELDSIDELRKQRAEAVADISSCEEDNARLKKAIAEANARLTEIAEQLALTVMAEADYQRAVDAVERYKTYLQLEQQLAVAQDRAALMQERIDSGFAELARINDQLSEVDKKSDGERAKAANKSNIQRTLNEHESTLRSLRADRDRLVGARSERVNAAESAERIKVYIDSLSQEIAAESRIASRCDTLKQAFGSNGIPHSIVRSVVPIIEATASNILGQMSGGRMSVELVTQKVLKSNNKKEVVALDIIINDADTGRLSYLSRSGGERVKAALSVILALSEVKSSDVGVQIGFLWLDEPPFLDAAGTQAYCDALETIQRRYAGKKIMAITHDESFKARFPQSVYVYKDEHGSHATLD